MYPILGNSLEDLCTVPHCMVQKWPYKQNCSLVLRWVYCSKILVVLVELSAIDLSGTDAARTRGVESRSLCGAVGLHTSKGIQLQAQL